MTIYCDACLQGLGFWMPELLLGFYLPTPSDCSLKGLIFFLEALCVVSAIHWYCKSTRKQVLTPYIHLSIFTNNLNTVDIFDSLKASPPYNVLLCTAIDLLIHHDIDLRVIHIRGEDNTIADAISHHDFPRAYCLSPGLVINSFQPPQDMLGAPSS